VQREDRHPAARRVDHHRLQLAARRRAVHEDAFRYHHRVAAFGGRLGHLAEVGTARLRQVLAQLGGRVLAKVGLPPPEICLPSFGLVILTCGNQQNQLLVHSWSHP